MAKDDTSSTLPVVGKKAVSPSFLSRIMAHRWAVFFLFRKELVALHRRSGLGVVWSIIFPILPIAVYVMLRMITVPARDANGVHPAVYVAVGVTLWFYFKDMVTGPLGMVEKYSAMIANTNLSLASVVAVALLMNLFNSLLRVMACVPVLLYFDNLVLDNALFGVLALGVGTLFFLSFGLAMIPFSIVFRDLKNLLELVFRYLIFFSLAIFPITRFGPLEDIVYLNPFAVLIDFVRLSVTTTHALPMDELRWILLAMPALLIAGIWILDRTRVRVQEAYR